jgi:hypothetical protein
MMMAMAPNLRRAAAFRGASLHLEILIFHAAVMTNHIPPAISTLRAGFASVLAGDPGEHWGALAAALPYAVALNGWFAEDQLREALQDWCDALAPENVEGWLDPYAADIECDISGEAPRMLAIVTAGNLPWVGLHDILCAVVAGHRVQIKTSGEDGGLTAATLAGWASASPGIGIQIELVDRLSDFDMVIATGSNTTRQHFERYFAHVPHLIRGQRSGLAVLSGDETHEQLVDLSSDIFRFFGLGCRSVSKIFVPRDFDLNRIFAALVGWDHLANHHRYVNNYTYHKALWLLEAVDLLENGFILFKEDEALSSPVATMFWERYDDLDTLNANLASRQDEIQCRIGVGGLPFGSAQRPGLADYADNVDTLAFLLQPSV